MTIRDIIIRYREDHSLSQRQFAEMCGLSNGYISMLEKGENPKTKRPIIPTLQALIKIARGMQMTLSDFLSAADDTPVSVSNEIDAVDFPSPIITENYVTFPVLGDIAAGYDSIAVEDWEGDVIEIPQSQLKGRDQSEFFVLRVKGDSMYPTYQDGDKVLILKQTTLGFSGQVGAILYEDENATLKKVEFVPGEDWLRLVPINANYPPKRIEGEELDHCRVIGIPRLLIREIED